MSGEMVRATLREIDPKSQTRRIVKPQPAPIDGMPGYYSTKYGFYNLTIPNTSFRYHCPYGRIGDRLWVRETFFQRGNVERGYPDDEYNWHGTDIIEYAATSNKPENNPDRAIYWRTMSSIFMRRRYSRILLEITNIRVERLQDISEEDAKAEGVKPCIWHRPYGGTEDDEIHLHPGFAETRELTPSYRTAYANLWDKINGKKHPWANNDWVWVIEFKRVSP